MPRPPRTRPRPAAQAAARSREGNRALSAGRRPDVLRLRRVVRGEDERDLRQPARSEDRRNRSQRRRHRRRHRRELPHAHRRRPAAPGKARAGEAPGGAARRTLRTPRTFRTPRTRRRDVMTSPATFYDRVDKALKDRALGAAMARATTTLMAGRRRGFDGFANAEEVRDHARAI